MRSRITQPDKSPPRHLSINRYHFPASQARIYLIQPLHPLFSLFFQVKRDECIGGDTNPYQKPSRKKKTTPLKITPA